MLKLVKQFIRQKKLLRKFPNSIIHKQSYVDDNSSLGSGTVLFSKVTLINSSVGDFSYIQYGSTLSSVKIGKFCSIASGVNIGLPQHSIYGVSSHPVFYLKQTPLPIKFSDQDLFSPIKKTVIGHDVWIGQNAIIMTGLNIGIGAVIGAGAVVTKDVPAYAVVGGVPARIIKYRFKEKMRNDLLESKWWEMPVAVLEKNFLLFQHPSEFVNALKHNLLDQ